MMLLFKNICKYDYQDYTEWSIDDTKDRDIFYVERHRVEIPKGFYIDTNSYSEKLFYKRGNPYGFELYTDKEGNPFIYDDWSGEVQYLKVIY